MADTTKLDKKRKRDDADKHSQAATSGNKKQRSFDDRKNNKGKKFDKKRKEEGKAKQPSEAPKKQEREEAFDESIGKMDGQLLADHFMQKARRHNKDLTAVELSDMSVPVHAFLDTTSFHNSRTLAQLPEFLKAFDPNKGAALGEASEEKGSPHTLVVAAAGLRAADLVRALRSLQSKEATVAKLFAKHIKIDEAKQFLERARVNIGVGTPQRIIDLLEAGSLKTQELKRIVIDGSHIDQKKRGVFDMKEMFFPLLKLLTRAEFRDRYDKDLKVVIY
ncbi:U3-containing 90S pre-ribosomal complex subunit-domain containing protein [Talaromyces proteolyticus]|uniref:U3-containing 90S pre-ribosomal complex subunit-domain containing protein n=1 Tax=Talaromyces proteolyticus TaxID=1131652 RepID=A0AAD4L1B8_9EURO|nr:U3-containing 90S pre-ribosomal complex subunit-domain containing protein [Talaromyces proteolyticus]KAH8703831.1 U3-containing 90S pre-ribosomal complex subunit-domain containing protein [Talaromyces proteolyticus]